MGKPWENHGKTMGKPWENPMNGTSIYEGFHIFLNNLIDIYITDAEDVIL